MLALGSRHLHRHCRIAGLGWVLHAGGGDCDTARRGRRGQQTGRIDGSEA